MIWPSGAGALSAAVYDWIFTLVLVLRFNRFCLFQQICNQLPSCGRLASSAEIPYCELTSFGAEFLQSAASRGGRSSPSGSKNHRTALYCRQADSTAAGCVSKILRRAGARRALRGAPRSARPKAPELIYSGSGAADFVCAFLIQVDSGCSGFATGYALP